MEIGTCVSDPSAILTPSERSRLEQLGHRRRPSFLAARVALKRLAVAVGRAQPQTDFRKLHTIAPDHIRPSLPGDDGDDGDDGDQLLHCSVAHDARYAVAVADTHPIGVDVEVASDRVKRVERAFVSPSEAALLPPTDRERRVGLTKIWTVKEAVTKAMGIPLAEAFVAVQITELGDDKSRFSLGGRVHTAYHDHLSDHVFTLVRFPP